MLSVNVVGEPLAGKRHERFDGGELEKERARMLMEPATCESTRESEKKPRRIRITGHLASSLPYRSRPVRRADRGNGLVERPVPRPGSTPTPSYWVSW
jgi:hypothetical protein